MPSDPSTADPNTLVSGSGAPAQRAEGSSPGQVNIPSRISTPTTSGTSSKGKISDDTWNAALARFIDSHVRNSPVAQNIEAWNHLGAVWPRFRQYLEEELGK